MELVGFNLAKKLKEKGFNEKCLAHYISEYYSPYNNYIDLSDDKYFVAANVGPSELDYEEFLRSFNTEGTKDISLRHLVDAPTISQVLKWLREEKDIDIVIYPIDRNTIYMGGEKYILSICFCGKRDYKINKDNNDKFVKWEDAAIAGIEYVINNLI